jgi:hypothetical protein
VQEDPEDQEEGSTGQQHGQRTPAYFRAVPVFDIGQTEGDELPSPVRKLTGDASEDLVARLVRFSEFRGCPVRFEDFEGSANGFYKPQEHSITVRASLASDHQAKTLAHEITHSILHTDIDEYREHRGEMELQAESCAFIICHHFGLDTSGYSFGYALGWSQGDEEAIKSLKASAMRISSTAKIIIEAITESEVDEDTEQVA